MNGFGLLLYVLAVGQVTNSGRSPTLPTLGTLAGATAAVDNNVYDYGWDIDQDGSLFYIMQIAPEEAQQMHTQGSEKYSDMPKELIGRVARISVRVGNSPLPRNPSLQEISLRPLLNARDVTAALDAMITPNDRLADVERPPVVNIQGQNGSSIFSQLGNPNRAPPPDYSSPRDSRATGLPTSPSNLSSSTGIGSPSGNPAAGVTGGLANAFLNDTAGGGGLPGLPNMPQAEPPSKFQSAEATGGNAAAGNQWSTAQDPYALPGGMSDLGRGSAGANPAAGLPQDYDRVQSQTGVFTGRERQPTTSLGFGTTPGSQPGSLADRLSAQPRPGYGPESAAYNTPGYSSAETARVPVYSEQDWMLREQALRAQMAQLPYDSARLASNPNASRGSLPSTDQVLPRDSTTQASNTQTAGATPPAGPTTSEQTGRAKNSTEGIIQVFFLLSLVVNFYLGMLIRKLLARYRTLLSNVRSQTA